MTGFIYDTELLWTFAQTTVEDTGEPTGKPSGTAETGMQTTFAKQSIYRQKRYRPFYKSSNNLHIFLVSSISNIEAASR